MYTIDLKKKQYRKLEEEEKSFKMYDLSINVVYCLFS